MRFWVWGEIESTREAARGRSSAVNPASVPRGDGAERMLSSVNAPKFWDKEANGLDDNMSLGADVFCFMYGCSLDGLGKE